MNKSRSVSAWYITGNVVPMKLKCQLRMIKVSCLHLHDFFWKSCNFMDLASHKSWLGSQVPIFPRNLQAVRERIKNNSRKCWVCSSLPADNCVILLPLLFYWGIFFWYLIPIWYQFDSQALVKRNNRKLNKSFLNRRDYFSDLLTRQIGHGHWRFLYRYSCILA